MARKALGWIAIIIGVIWLIHNPQGAANLAHQIIHALTTLANNL